MWKIVLAFVAFAALALFVLSRGGGNIDMSGEKHGADTPHGPEVSASAPVLPASPAVPPASPASVAK